jgi:hypothetical protein
VVSGVRVTSRGLWQTRPVICDGCGTTVDTVFCGVCGRRLRSTTELPDVSQAQVQRRVVYRERVTARTWMLLAAAVMLAVAGAGLVVAALTS